jgi:hypothetical protein
MGSRLELQTLFESLMGPDPNVYYQAPTNSQMQYPCILYNRDNSHSEFADNLPYSRTKRYLVTVIDRDPDSELPDKVEDLPCCSFNRFYSAENLNHFVFTLFF